MGVEWHLVALKILILYHVLAGNNGEVLRMGLGLGLGGVVDCLRARAIF